MSKTEFKYSVIRQYLLGFIFSVVLTSLAFISIGWDFSTDTIVIILLALAVTQIFTQLVFFLHINKEPSPKWSFMIFMLAAWFVLAIIIGSIWIMSNLDYNMMNKDTDKQIILDEGYPIK